MVKIVELTRGIEIIEAATHRRLHEFHCRFSWAIYENSPANELLVFDLEITRNRRIITLPTSKTLSAMTTYHADTSEIQKMIV